MAKITDSLKITPKVIEYLSENSMLAKAKGYIKDVTEPVTVITGTI